MKNGVPCAFCLASSARATILAFASSIEVVVCFMAEHLASFVANVGYHQARRVPGATESGDGDRVEVAAWFTRAAVCAGVNRSAPAGVHSG
jgi:hypothetical protein